MTDLRPITKNFADTLRQDGSGRVLRRECWEATTVDGEWAFERIEDVGTPWIIVHHPRTPRAETIAWTWGTLKAAREALERGLDHLLPSTQLAAHANGEHAERYNPYGCPTCRDEETAAWAARRRPLCNIVDYVGGGHTHTADGRCIAHEEAGR